MESQLDAITIPFCALHGSVLCLDSCHCTSLESYYCDIVNAIAKADLVLPRKRHGNARDFWTPELTELKHKSIDSCKLWRSAGCPRNGLLFHEKCKAHLHYKRAIRAAKRTDCQEKTDLMYSKLADGDKNEFWKRFNSLNKRPANVSRIDGHADNVEIAESFRKTYTKVYDSIDMNAEAQLKDKFESLFDSYFQLHHHDMLSQNYFSWQDMLTAISKLKVGKASAGFVKSQHIFLGSPKLAIHLHLLYNGLLQYSYVPYDFLQGSVTPVLKDSNGNLNESNNYRPVTLSHTFSQLFEQLLLQKIDCYLVTDDLQFGFKKKRSTSHALFVLSSCVDYFVNHGSDVIATFLDCSKAFDKVSHNGIFIKMIERGVPLCFVNLLVYWYSNLTYECKWGDALSSSFPVPSGVKQGGVLSPHLFTMYMDDLVNRLRSKGVGCHVARNFVAAILFADDLCLIAPSRKAMQIMLDICVNYCREFCLTFNAAKSKSMLIGKGHTHDKPKLFINDQQIEFVSEWKYLGATLTAAKSLSFSPKRDLSNFYSSFNSIHNSHTRPSELVLMSLLYSNCVPCLTYAADVKNLPASDMSKCNSALNNAIRRIFGFNQWESIRTLRSQFGYPDIYTIFEKRRLSFYTQLENSSNGVLKLFLSISQ